MVVIRWKDIFESLEAAVDACETVAHVLEGITLKQRRGDADGASDEACYQRRGGRSLPAAPVRAYQERLEVRGAPRFGLRDDRTAGGDDRAGAPGDARRRPVHAGSPASG